jgi:glycerophosphoryl diester phosphodiesterase
MKDVIIFGHRGAPLEAPENTLPAFREAVLKGVGGIELDVHLTKDEKIVVTHDHELGRTCNGKGIIKDMYLSDLRMLDFGSWFSEVFKGEKIPLLEEVIEFLYCSNLILNIEIKAEPGKYNENIEKKLAGIIRKYDISERTIISSFNHLSLKKIKGFDKGIRTAPLFVAKIIELAKYVKELGAYAVHPYYGTIDQELIIECKANGIKVNAWTVDKREDVKRLAEAGVDGIITNCPGLFVGLQTGVEII